MRMLVGDRSVPVATPMQLRDAFVRRVRVLVTFVAPVRVLMRERFVRVRVLVPLREVQPDAAGGQAASHPEAQWGRLTKQDQGRGIAVAQRAGGSACPGGWMSRFL